MRTNESITINSDEAVSLLSITWSDLIYSYQANETKWMSNYEELYRFLQMIILTGCRNKCFQENEKIYHYSLSWICKFIDSKTFVALNENLLDDRVHFKKRSMLMHLNIIWIYHW